MPTYQYACTACDHRFEQVQSFTDASLTECPECAGRLRKLYGSVGVVFKGSGFYRTDSRATSSAGSGSAEKAKESAPSSGGSSSTGGEKSEKSSTTASNSSSSSSGTTKPVAKAS